MIPVKSPGPRPHQAGQRRSTLRWEEALAHAKLERPRALSDVGARRGQSLSQLALTWVLRDPGVSSVIIGASSIHQLGQNLGALEGGPLSEEELKEIDTLSL
ncbi:aldo/keto reductase [Streptomyces sp. JL4002]|uniref:aldo/keto reductase n=1 Tax=Streptomyces sp. JL4002 TaxID=3404781 RepID=UPI003B286884